MLSQDIRKETSILIELQSHCFLFIFVLYLFFLVYTGREKRQAAVWSCSSELLVFLQHLVVCFIFVGFAVFSFGLLGIVGKYFDACEFQNW